MPILAAAVTFLAVFGAWQRQKAQEDASNAPTDPAGLFLATQAAGTSLTGAGRTRGTAQPCTAWLLDTGSPSRATAYAVTAGRCVGAIDAVSVISDEPLAGASIDLNDFARVSTSAPPNAVPVAVDRVEWASARWTDLAILRLGTTYGELAAQGIQAIRAGAAPSDGTEILVASVPVEGIPGDQQYLRGSRCTTGRTADVLEDRLLWRDARATDCAGILGGSAGAPVFNQAGEAVALVATTTIGAPEGPDCGPGRACEVRDGGVQPMAADTTYVLPVAGLEACFADGEFTIAGSCPLEDPATVVRASTPSPSGTPGATAPVRLDPTSPAPDAGVADRSGPMGQVDCFDPEGWSTPVAADDWSLDLTLPASGWQLACIGSPEQPSPVVVAVAGPGSEG
jgi:hypothetical protein